MDRLDFDVVGVRAGPGSPILGFVKRDQIIEGRADSYLRPIDPGHVVSDSSHFAVLLEALQYRSEVFVLSGSEISGIVTRADLNKPAVRVYLFAVLTLAELHLTFWIRELFPGDEWEQALSAIRLEKAREQLASRQVRNPSATLRSCLQLCDKRDLLEKKDVIQAVFGFKDRREFRTHMKAVEFLRNDLMHSQPTLNQATDWPQLIELVGRMESWIHLSDQAIERQAIVLPPESLFW